MLISNLKTKFKRSVPFKDILKNVKTKTIHVFYDQLSIIKELD